MRVAGPESGWQRQRSARLRRQVPGPAAAWSPTAAGPLRGWREREFFTRRTRGCCRPCWPASTRPPATSSADLRCDRGTAGPTTSSSSRWTRCPGGATLSLHDRSVAGLGCSDGVGRRHRRAGSVVLLVAAEGIRRSRLRTLAGRFLDGGHQAVVLVRQPRARPSARGLVTAIRAVLGKAPAASHAAVADPMRR